MKICGREVDATSRCPQSMSESAPERLYTDSPPKFTPNKLIVNFLEQVALHDTSRARLKRRCQAVLFANEPNFMIDIQRRKNTH